MQSLTDLFQETLKDVYFAEKALLKALPKLAKKANSSELKQALINHAEETEGQVERLDQIFKMLGKKSQGKPCPAMKGLVEEAEEVAKEAEEENTLDAGLLGAAQAVEHYEIARYGTLKAWAETLGHDKIAGLLQETLEEEEACDELLNELAAQINQDAHASGDDEEEEAPAPRAMSRKSKGRRETAGSSRRSA